MGYFRWWTVFLLAATVQPAQWNTDFTPIHPSTSLHPRLSYTPSGPLLLTLVYECRQVGLISCIGHCQSSSVTWSLMISIFSLSCLSCIYLSCQTIRLFSHPIAPVTHFTPSLLCFDSMVVVKQLMYEAVTHKSNESIGRQKQQPLFPGFPVFSVDFIWPCIPLKTLVPYRRHIVLGLY